jgi:hypothetical protein
VWNVSVEVTQYQSDAEIARGEMASLHYQLLENKLQQLIVDEVKDIQGLNLSSIYWRVSRDQLGKSLLWQTALNEAYDFVNRW